MKKSTIILLSIIALVAIFSFTAFNQYRILYDENVKLISRFKAQKETIKLNFDNMFKVLKQKAQVTDKAVESFKSIYIPMIEGRYSKGDGSLMKWVTEQNPQFDQTVYKDLMQTIEAKRNDFYIQQKALMAIKEQHDNLRQKFWSHILLGDIPELEYKLITSTATEEAVKTGKEDDIDVFDKK